MTGEDAFVSEMAKHIVLIEGGYVDHPDDRGGATKYGVTQATLSDYLGRPATKEDVKNLTPETAVDIFLGRYYRAPGINGLPSRIQPVVFDMSVNHGPWNAVRMVQQVLNLAGFTCDVDGRIGPETRRKASEADKAMRGFLVNAICERRVEFYHAIVERRPSQKVFLRGWLRRADEFRVEVD